MTEQGFAIFDTDIGRCSIAWGERGIVGVHLPEGREVATRALVTGRFPGAREAPPPPHVQRAIDAIGALFRGEASNLSGVVLDMDRVPPFHRRVYEEARRIAPGATLSYGEVARRLGAPGSARAVGQALGRNPFAIVVPCHRVLAAGGRAGGFSANGGITTKLRMLSIEVQRASGGAGSFEGDGVFGFDAATALEHLRASDAALARLIEAAGPFRMRLTRTPSLFVALAESIVYQQLNGKAAATIFARVCALFPRAHEGPTADRILRASDEKLRGAGLSRPKLLSLRDLRASPRTARFRPSPRCIAWIATRSSSASPGSAASADGRSRCSSCSASAGRTCCRPTTSAFAKGLRSPSRRGSCRLVTIFERRGARWKPYRTVASWYLWRAAELAKLPRP